MTIQSPPPNALHFDGVAYPSKKLSKAVLYLRLKDENLFCIEAEKALVTRRPDGMNVIVAFPKLENAKSIRSILMKSGYSVSVVATTGAQALSHAQGLGSGILVCSARFADMMYTEIYESMPEAFMMLLVASPAAFESVETEKLTFLPMPLQVHELLREMELLGRTLEKKKRALRQKPKERTKEQEDLIQRAKERLMKDKHFSEEEAHRYIQKRSMDNATSMVETAQMVLQLIE